MIIETYKIGNTTIEIHDDAIVTSQEEIEQILAQVTEIAKSWLAN
ncbi:MAG: hypothetical protein PHV03_11390 [Desulfitobacteriaceae bacterium]|nr:hypothetical protein [Desulfitobacteriaceae bacterium]